MSSTAAPDPLTPASASPSSSATRTVLESADLLGLIFEALPLTAALSVARVCKEWKAVSQPPLSDEARNAPCCIRISGTSAGGAGLARYALPDAIFPAQFARGGAENPRARIAPAAAVAAPIPSAPAPAPSASPAPIDAAPEDPSNAAVSTEDAAAAVPPLSSLHCRALLDLSSLPSTLEARQTLLRSFRHRLSKLRRVVLRGPAEQLAAPEFLGMIHPRTLGDLEELSACDCLVGQALAGEDAEQAGLYPTLRRWSLTPLDNSPEHARLHPLRESSLASLLPLCTNLRTLNVAHCKLWDTSLALIGAHTHDTLTALNLNFNVDVTNVGLRSLNRCARLRELQLQRCWKLSVEGVREFFAAIAAGWMALQQKEARGAAPAAAGGASRSGNTSLWDSDRFSRPHCDLRLINLNENRQRGADCLGELIVFTPLLEHAELSELNIQAGHLQNLGEKCTKLRRVNLCRVGTTPPTIATTPAEALAAAAAASLPAPPGAVTDRSVFAPEPSASSAAGPADPTHLRNGDAGSSSALGLGLGLRSVGHILEARITDLGLSYLSSSCRGLQKLDLERSHITNRGLKFLSVRHLPELQHLSLWQCEEIGDLGIQMLLGLQPEPSRASPPGIHPTLSFILLPANTSAITSASTELIVTLCPRLRHLVGYVPVSTAAQLETLHRLHASTLRSLSVHMVDERTWPVSVAAERALPKRDHIRSFLSSFSLLRDFVWLECLDLTVPKLRDEDLRVLLFSRAASLKVLKISKAANVTDEAFNWTVMGQMQSKGATTNAAAPPGPAASASTSAAFASRPAATMLNKPSFGAFVASHASVAFSSGSAVAAPAAASGPTPTSLAYFSPSSIGWSCSIELVYLSHMPSISTRTLVSFAQLPSVRYIDAAACETLSQEDRKIDRLQRELRTRSEAGTRHPLTMAVHQC